MSQEVVGQALGLTRQAVNRWEAGAALPTAANRRDVERFLATLEEGQAGGVPRDTPDSADGADAPGAAVGYSRLARVREQELRTEAARQGLDDEELAAISRAMRDLALAPAFDFGGRPRLLSEDEQRMEVEALTAGIRAWIDVRARLRRERARG